jgi:hypothetical protein
MTAMAPVEKLIRAAKQRLYWHAWLRAFGFPIAILLGWTILALLGGIISVPPLSRAILTGFVLLGSAGLLVFGLKSFRKPTRQDAIKLIDTAANESIISSKLDTQTRYDAESSALWKAHQAQLDDKIRTTKPPSLLGKVQKTDPLFLRYLLPVLLLISGLVAQDSLLPRLQSTYSADFGTLVGADKTIVQAWVTPPAYTGQPPQELQLFSPETVQIPAGSQLTIRTQSRLKPKLKALQNDQKIDVPFLNSEANTYQAELNLSASANFEIAIHVWGERAKFLLSTLEDAPPETDFKSLPKSDDTDKFEFVWSALDDYGVAEMFLRISPANNSTDTPQLVDAIPLDIPGIEPLSAENSVKLNLTRHKWAGQEVTLTLEARDAAGQSGFSQPFEFVLPEKLFLQPQG